MTPGITGQLPWKWYSDAELGTRNSELGTQNSLSTGQQPSERSQDYAIPRERMVARLREHYGIRDSAVLEAMRAVPRHAFVPEALQGRAYGDHALPISANQTISQPYIVARMTELLRIDKESRVLEVGAGSGYQTAVLAKIAGQVYALERIGDLLGSANAIRALGIITHSESFAVRRVGRLMHRYDAILVAAGGPNIPELWWPH